jgi:hypothetical protein
MFLLESNKAVIIEDYKSLSLTELSKKYQSTKYFMRKFLVKNGIAIKTAQTQAENILTSKIKQCSLCKLSLSLENFNKNKNKYRSRCKKCRALSEPSRPEYHKKWRCENIEKKSKMDKDYREKNSEKIKSYRKTQEYKIKKAFWYKTAYEKIKKDPIKYLSKSVKSAMSMSIKFNKQNHYFEIVGYSLENLKAHLEKTFKKGMSWDNYGRNGWHIDHIKPLVLFDLSEEEEFKKAWCLDNLQALWEFENCSKGSWFDNQRHRSNSKHSHTKK